MVKRLNTSNALVQAALREGCSSVPELVLKKFLLFRAGPSPVGQTARLLGVDSLTVRHHLASALAVALDTHMIDGEKLLEALK